jgi:hypothetical protein
MTANSRIAIFGLAAALALTASPAFAAKKKGGAKLRTATASATVAGAFTPVEAIATCPKGTKVVAGGYTTSAPSMPSNWLNVSVSQRVGPRSWRVAGAEYFAGTDTLTTYAYCQAFRGKISARSTQVAVPTTADAGAVVQTSCPKGTKAISGGFSTEIANVSDSTYVSRSIAAGGNRWVVDATRLSGSSGRSLFAHAYCAPAPVKNRFEDAAVTGPLGTAHTATTPACPKGMTALGGGFATSTPAGGLLNAALVYETKRAGAGWSTTAAPSSGGTSITLVSAAYCR